MNSTSRLAMFFLFALPGVGWGVERLVSDKAQFAAALKVAQPGDAIVWKDGTYDNLGTIAFEPAAQGTRDAPIVLRAQTPGRVVFRGNTKLALGGHFLVAAGLRFDNSNYPFSGPQTAGSVIEFRAHSSVARHAYDCRVTECAIVNYDNPAAQESSKWILMYGSRNFFDRNLVTGKRTRGTVLIVELNEPPDVVEAGHRIEGNIFADGTPRPLVGRDIGADQTAPGATRPRTPLTAAECGPLWSAGAPVSPF